MKKKKPSVYDKLLLITTPVFLIIRDTQDPDNEIDRFRILYPDGNCEWMSALSDNESTLNDEYLSGFTLACYIAKEKFNNKPTKGLADTINRMKKFDYDEHTKQYTLKIIEVIPL